MPDQSKTLPTTKDDERFLPAHPDFDHDKAMWEGWQISHMPNIGEVTDEGHYRIEPLTRFPIFATAEAAWTFVSCQAMNGSGFHIRTLRFIRWHNPQEWERIATHASLALGIDLLSYTSGSSTDSDTQQIKRPAN